MNCYFDIGGGRVFGTFPLTGDELAQALEHAAGVGYRAIDTAQMYGNEDGVGAFLASRGADRGHFHVTTKVHPDRFDSEADFLTSVEESLTRLGGDKLDMLLLHWPPVGGDIKPSLTFLQAAFERGMAHEIGVSNYTRQMMHDAKRIIDAPIAVNQVEFHPLLDQRPLLKAAEETGIPLSSYCSLARGEVSDKPALAKIGAAHGKTASQVALRWILQKGVAAITMSTKPKNVSANFDILDFELTPAEMGVVDELMVTNFRVVTSAKVPWAPQWDTPAT